MELSSSIGRTAGGDSRSPDIDQFQSICVAGLKVQGLPSTRKLFGKRKYYLKIAMRDGVPRVTKAMAPTTGTITWSDTLYFGATGTTSAIGFSLYEEHTVHNMPMGRIEWNSEDSLQGGSEASMNCSVEIPRSGSTSLGDEAPVTLEFTVSIVGPRKRAVYAVQGANQRVDDMNLLTHHAVNVESHVEGLQDVEESVNPVVEACGSLLEKLKFVQSAMDAVSEVHPYLKIAVTVIGGVQKIVLKQEELDDKIKELLSVMNEAFTFVKETDALRKKGQEQEKIINRMVQQTIDCGYFLQTYANRKNFAARLVNNLLSSIDETIDGYRSTFEKLKIASTQYGTLQTQIDIADLQVNVVQIASDLSTLADQVDVSKVPHVPGAKYQLEKTCLPGTRQQILDEITEWVNDPNGPRVCLLTGAAGRGKSAVAHTVARLFDNIKRLASSFCFSRNESGRTPDKLFSSVARDLADYDKSGQYRHKLAQLSVSTATSQSITEQFQEFISGIVETLDFVGPVLFVFDGLDESARASEPKRKVMLRLLSQETKKLPRNFRFLISSRPELDIIKEFDDPENTVHKTMEDLFDVDKDIRLYVIDQLTDKPGQFLRGLDDKMCTALVPKAEGLFQWAYVACAAIRADGQAGSSPRKRYQRLMAQETVGLDGLYQQVLSALFRPDDLDEFRRILGFVLASFEPLTVTVLETLYQTGGLGNPEEIRSNLEFMGSLLTGVTNPSTPVRPLHTSFRDFLTEHTRSKEFYIDIGLNHSRLCLASLRLMNTSLRFNMCRLETSYMRNQDIMDLDARVSKAISSELSYACRFWGRHLEQIDFNHDIHRLLARFLRGSLLYWIETLSFLKCVNVAREFLSNAVNWLKMNDQELCKFATDAARFVSMFAQIAVESVPHIYLSALPLAPKNSIVRKHFTAHFRQTISTASTGLHDWPALQMDIRGHEGPVNSVAFSPDGTRVVSGSGDGTIRVWDVETGELVSRPYTGHGDCVSPVAFSPDGTRVVSGSEDQTIRVYDSQPCIGNDRSGNSYCSNALGSTDVRVPEGGKGPNMCSQHRGGIAAAELLTICYEQQQNQTLLTYQRRQS